VRIAITGGSGTIGRAVIARGVADGHCFVSIDLNTPRDGAAVGEIFVRANAATDYETVRDAVRDCDALIHLAAIAGRGRNPEHVAHDVNVAASYNMLCIAAECGITRVCQASSVSAIGLSISRSPRFDYFPLDEKHPSYNEDAYSLSKWLCEQQADSIARRYAQMSIASLRFSWVIAARAVAQREYLANPRAARSELVGYTLLPAAVDACLLSLSADFRGHEIMFAVAPNTASDTPTLELARAFHPSVPIRGHLGEHRSFFDSSKATRILGWRHEPRPSFDAADRSFA
jgi:nucleoside-diphosphate-sugar epimerase